MMRIGWEVVSPLEWRTHRGIINIEDACPRGVEKLAQEAAQNWLWSKMHGGDDALRDVPAMPLLEPMVKLLQPAARGRDWEAKDQGCLRMAVVGGRWSQERRHRAGYTESDVCTKCLAAVGTDHHDVYDCPGFRAFRTQYNAPALLSNARRRPEMALWTQALMTDPSRDFPAPLMVHQIIWEKAAADGRLQGIGYGDGSGLRPRHAAMRRCGWGLIMHTPGIGITARLYGPLPGWQQDVPAAVSWAFWVLLTNFGIGQVEFVTDCKFVLDTFTAGPSRSSSGWFFYAGIWRSIWWRVADIGLENVMMRWVPAHTSQRAVNDGTISFLDQICNKEADERAKAGAKMHPDSDEVANRVEKSIEVVAQVAR